MRVCGWMLAAALVIGAAPGGAMGATELPVGEAMLRFPVPAGYARASVNAPALFEVSAAAMPPERRMVEAFYRAEDLAEMETGKPIPGMYYQVLVLRAQEHLALDPDTWPVHRNAFARQLRAFDAEAEHAAEEAANARMSRALGRGMRVQRREIGAPVIHAEDAASLRFHQVVGSVHEIDGIRTQTRVITVAAYALLANRAVLLHLNGHDEGPGSLERLQAALDAQLDRLQALNPSPLLSSAENEAAADAGSGPGVDEERSRGYGWLLGVLAVLILVVVMRGRSGASD